MDKPPQKSVQEVAKKMEIAPEQFRDLAAPQSTMSSYLQLLPRDIAGTVEQYAYNNLAQKIYYLRKDALNDPLKGVRFFGFSGSLGEQLATFIFNQGLIDAFKDQVPSLKLPEDINLTNEEVVAILLNTPASFGLIKGNFATIGRLFDPPKTTITPAKIAVLFMIYVREAQLNYEEAVTYAFQLLQNMEKSGLRDFVRYTKDGFAITVMNFLLKEYPQKFNAHSPILSEVQILVDLGASNIISRLISYGSDANADWAYLYTQLKNRLGEKPEIAVCNSLSLLLAQALQNKDHLKVETIVNSIFYIAVLDQKFADCFAVKLKEQLGASLVDYLMESDEHSLPFNALWPHFIEILWNHAIKSSGITAKKIVRLLLCFNLNIGWHTPQKLSFAYPVDAMREQAAQLKKLVTQFLLDVVQKGLIYQNLIIILLNAGADYNHVDAQGVTLLMHAIQKGDISLVRILLDEKDINKNACDKQGHNAFWYARNLETDMATRLAIIQLLQQAGVTEEGTCAIQ